MNVGKERNQAQYGNDLELELLRLMRHSFGKRMQVQIDVADPENRKDQEDAHHDHQDIRLAGPGDVKRQMMRRHRIKLIGQLEVPLRPRRQPSLLRHATVRRRSRLSLIWIKGGPVGGAVALGRKLSGPTERSCHARKYRRSAAHSEGNPEASRSQGGGEGRTDCPAAGRGRNGEQGAPRGAEQSPRPYRGWEGENPAP